MTAGPGPADTIGTRRTAPADERTALGFHGSTAPSQKTTPSAPAAHEQLMHSGQYAFRDRRARKGDFRRLWVQRVNAASRANGLSYSRLIAGLKAADVEVDRKVLADLAVRDEPAFARLVDLARESLPASEASPTSTGSGELAGVAAADASGTPATTASSETAEQV